MAIEWFDPARTCPSCSSVSSLSEARSSSCSRALVACATLQNLCHDAAWAKKMVAAGVEARLEALVSHSDARVVRYASGALKNLTIASATMGSPAPQLSATANKAVRAREMEASLEQFSRRRALRVIARRTREMDARARLKRLLRAPADARDALWLDAISELHGTLEEEAQLLEFALSRASATERPPMQAELNALLSDLSAIEAAVTDALAHTVPDRPRYPMPSPH